MNCPKCNTLNTPTASFCKNCGTQLAIFPVMEEKNSNTKTINLMVIYFGLICLQSLFYLGVNKWLFSSGKAGNSNYGTDLGKIVNKVSMGMGWIFGLGEIVMLLLLALSIRQKTAQTWMIIFVVVQVIVFIAWRIIPLFTSGFDIF